MGSGRGGEQGTDARVTRERWDYRVLQKAAAEGRAKGDDGRSAGRADGRRGERHPFSPRTPPFFDPPTMRTGRKRDAYRNQVPTRSVRASLSDASWSDG